MTVAKHFAMQILARREALGLTQRQLAEELGLEQTQISAYERGAREPRAGRILLFAKALNLDPNTLLGWESD